MTDLIPDSILSNQADPSNLELEPSHPGLGDTAYVQRREELFALCRKHRLERIGPPIIQYTPDETAIWCEVSRDLDEPHRKHACSIYLKGKDALAISTTEVPQLRHLSDRLQRKTGMHLVPAEGGLEFPTFYGSIAERGFPVTQFLRHKSQPAFTPEPDMVHDCLGHVPPLMNGDYADFLTLIGKAAVAANGEHRLVLQRFAWFTIEMGLVQEGTDVKALGAAILSSTKEINHALFSGEVVRQPFVTNVVINTEYDYRQLQDCLFIAPSFSFLRCELGHLLRRLSVQAA